MKLLPLNKGLFAKVDDEDYERLMNHKWYFWTQGNNTYCLSRINNKITRLHRFILGVTDPNIIIDHINMDGMDNQKHNLRIASASQNAKNRRPSGKSKFLGVSIHKAKYTIKKTGEVISHDGYISHIKGDNKYIHLGRFPLTPCGELLAALKYDEAAIKYHGEFARLNFSV